MISALADATSENFFSRPAALYSVSERPGIYTRFSRPLRNGASLAAKLDKVIGRLIISLLGCRCPSAVIWRVTQIIVDAIDAIFVTWAWPHISEKLLETMPPLVANGDSAPPIPTVMRLIRIFTARNHRLPNSMLTCFAPPMCSCKATDRFPLEASATGDFPCCQISATNYLVVSTLAGAQPSSFPLGQSPDIAKHGQPTEHLPSQIANLFIRYRHNLGEFLEIAIVGNCKQWQLGYIIHSVISSFQLLTTPRDDSSHRRGNLFPAHIIAYLDRKRLAEVTA